jgi:D-glycero-D-manno-heptose 1,7-bisphosphate phosphatase
MKAVFLDRDGTVIVGTPVYERVGSLDKVVLLPDTITALRLLATLDYKVFFVTNQSGVAEGLITLEEADVINRKVLDLVAPSGIAIAETYVCPHQDSDHCDCRKPKPKMILDAAAKYGIDLAESWMIGDRPTDVETGINAGTKAILTKTGNPDVHSALAAYTAPTLLAAIQYIAEQDRQKAVAA